MAQTYDAIASYTFGSAASSYTFSSIAASWTDLILIGNWAQDSGTVREMAIRLNGDTGTNYSITELYGNGTSAASYRRSNQTYLDICVNSPAVTKWNVKIGRAHV